MHLGNPVIRSYYKNGFAKHYMRDHDVLRIEAATNNVKKDYDINKGVENLAPSARNCKASPPAIRRSNRTSLRRSLIAANSEALASRPCLPMASGFLDSNWTIHGNWP